MSLQHAMISLVVLIASASLACGAQHQTSGGPAPVAEPGAPGATDQPAPVIVPAAPASPAAPDTRPLVLAGSGEDSEPADAASGFGKYVDLIKTLDVPADREEYGEYNDYGLWGPGMWAGAMQPEGYWVYVAPRWYIWRTLNPQRLRPR